VAILYFGYSPRESQTNATTRGYVGKIRYKGRFTNDGVNLEAIEFIGYGTPGYSGGAVCNTNMEIIALMAKARDEWFADGTTSAREWAARCRFEKILLCIAEVTLRFDRQHSSSV
jgi:hypothetical protein